MKFEVGLTLTGTVSAGAYTAGVIDFITEAFEEWEKERQRNFAQHGNDYDLWDTPWHEVVINGLSGASGGGVSCGLILQNIGKEINHVRFPSEAIGTDNDFYNAWVNLLGIEQLLSIEDITSAPVKSLLNARAIPKIADKLLVHQSFGNTLRRPYISEHLIAIITLTNLRGIPYILDYQGIQRNNVLYYRSADYASFELSSDNLQQYPQSYLLPYNMSAPEFSKTFAKLKAACLCTCAVPGGFRAQPFEQPVTVYKNRKYGVFLDNLQNPLYDFLNCDGGTLNTEPFRLLHDALLPAGETINPSDPEHLVRTIIMVAPLEIGEVFDEQDDHVKDDGLLQVAPAVLNAIRSEALFSAEEINKAFDESIYSRFMIAPARSSSRAAADFITPAITGTILGTFGAFLSKDFRAHDYFTGRRNAQQFLRRHFAVPVDRVANNPVFGPLNIRQRYPGYCFNDGGVDYFPIIPLCGTAAVECYFPEWPAGKGYDMDNIREMLDTRVAALLNSTIDAMGLGFFAKLFASLAKKEIRNFVGDKIVKAIETSLEEANL